MLKLEYEVDVAELSSLEDRKEFEKMILSRRIMMAHDIKKSSLILRLLSKEFIFFWMRIQTFF